MKMPAQLLREQHCNQFPNAQVKMSRTFNVDLPKGLCGLVEAHYNVFIQYCKTILYVTQVSELGVLFSFIQKWKLVLHKLALHDSIIEMWWPSRLPADLCVILYSQGTNLTWVISLSFKSIVAKVRVHPSIHLLPLIRGQVVGAAV